MFSSERFLCVTVCDILHKHSTERYSVVYLFHKCHPECEYVYSTYAWCPRRSEEGISSPQSRAINDGEPPCRSWELNLCSQQEELLLATEPTPKMILAFVEMHVLIQFKSFHFLKYFISIFYTHTRLLNVRSDSFSG